MPLARSRSRDGLQSAGNKLPMEHITLWFPIILYLRFSFLPFKYSLHPGDNDLYPLPFSRSPMFRSISNFLIFKSAHLGETCTTANDIPGCWELHLRVLWERFSSALVGTLPTQLFFLSLPTTVYYGYNASLPGYPRSPLQATLFISTSFSLVFSRPRGKIDLTKSNFTVKVINEEAGKLIHCSNVYHNEWAPKLAEKLVQLTQSEGGLGFRGGEAAGGEGLKVFFANSGTEANEGALKIARRYGKSVWAKNGGREDACTKNHIVCFENSFHGRSMGALSVTSNPKYQKPFEPLIPNVHVGKLNDIEALEGLITGDTCGVIVEPIQGEGGINAPTEEWLRALRKRCNEVEAVLIYDEIQCGLFRSGSMWAHSKMPVDCHPDILTMAKPLANGFPIGALMVKDHIASPMGVGTHGTTFGGSPLSCAVGYHVVQRLSSPAFAAEVAETSRHLDRRLSQLPQWYPGLLKEVRGRGLIRGLGFKDSSMPGRIVELARERGVFFLTAGKDAVRLVPSLNVGKEGVDLAMDVLESCLHLCSESKK
ncbi:pyridoxal phosphate-dependent transferase [Flammula alnicola]|nr:pyridoxal phosphate-dependent transferase [Flammula alnicola]